MSENCKNNPEISVVVLCYRAEDAIRSFVSNLTKLMAGRFGDDYELILVGNYLPGSGDSTPLIVREIARESANIVAVAKPKAGMMGWDLRSGLAAATGKNIAVIDGDEQMPIEDIIRVYEVLKKENADLVKTFRITRGDGVWRKFISWVYNILFKLLFPGLKARDVNSKPKILTRTAYEKLKLEADDWFVDAEIMIQARRQQFRICELPTLFRGLGGRRRSFVRFPAILQFIKNLFIYRLKEFKKR